MTDGIIAVLTAADDDRIAGRLGISAATVKAARLGRSVLGREHRRALVRHFGEPIADLLCPIRKRKSVAEDYRRLRTAAVAAVATGDLTALRAVLLAAEVG